MNAGEEECLYTNEATLQGGTESVFEATACHSVVLSAAEQLTAPVLFGTTGLPQDLRFEVRSTNLLLQQGCLQDELFFYRFYVCHKREVLAACAVV